jgi:hypothetical protein
MPLMRSTKGAYHEPTAKQLYSEIVCETVSNVSCENDESRIDGASRGAR